MNDDPMDPAQNVLRNALIEALHQYVENQADFLETATPRDRPEEARARMEAAHAYLDRLHMVTIGRMRG